MGKRDSSQTRVVPVFDRLYAIDKTGESWIPKLLRLPSCGHPLCLQSRMRCAIEDIGWGKNEKKLDPPESLLSWLIHNPRLPSDGRLSSDPIKAKKRRELIDGLASRRDEALALLDNNPSGEDWHIFEGKTQPDVFIKTPDLIIVIEGKRTEPETTKKTKWMDGRHQMLRHIDCAWEIRENRQVIGFLVVEGHGNNPEVPEFWIEESRITAGQDAMKTSLPHRAPQDQVAIANCYIGVTTWQRICKEFCLDLSNLPDIMDHNTLEEGNNAR